MRRTPIDDELIQLVLAAPRPEREELVLDLELITPMIGGGAVPGEVDRDMPIRASEIVGHLRTWWRRQFGYGYADMKDREAAIFGAAAGDEGRPSGFEIEVEQEPAKDSLIQNLEHVASLPKYVTGILLQGRNKEEQKQEQKAIIEVLTKHPFKVRLTRAKLSDSQWKQLRYCCECWSAYGGVGARVSRGCGAVAHKGARKLPQPIWFHDHHEPVRDGVQTFRHCFAIVGPRVESCHLAHKLGIDFLMCLEKGYPLEIASVLLAGRTEQSKREQRFDILRNWQSWIAEEDKRLTGLDHSFWENEKKSVNRQWDEVVTPRAVFGLPRSYGKGGPVLNYIGDGNVATRVVSPLHIRPIREVAQGQEHWRPLIIAFNISLDPSHLKLGQRDVDSISLIHHAPPHFWYEKERATESLISLLKQYRLAMVKAGCKGWDEFKWQF